VWTPIPDYKTAQLCAILTSEPIDDPFVMEDNEEDIHPDPLKFVPPQYHNFTDIFSKTSALKLPPSCLFDHAIVLEDGMTPGHSPIYSLSEPEHASFKEFINEHLATGTIHPSQSPISALVLFIKGGGGSLCMVTDYWKLNTIMRKDWYLIPCINNLLERLGKAFVFTKIDL
jgi:hypothetical protein